MGHACLAGDSSKNIDLMLFEADENMYAEKQQKDLDAGN